MTGTGTNHWDQKCPVPGPGLVPVPVLEPVPVLVPRRSLVTTEVYLLCTGAATGIQTWFSRLPVQRVNHYTIAEEW